MTVIMKKVFTILVLCCLDSVLGQSEWVWGKNSGNGNPNRPQQSGNIPISASGSGGNINGNNNNRPTGSNLVPVNTVTIFGNGAGVVSNGQGGSASTGSQFFGSPTGTSGTQPAVIVQVLPGASQSRPSQAGNTIPASPTSATNNNLNNDDIPSNAVRAVNGEPRLFGNHLRKLFQNTISNLVGNGGSTNTGGGTLNQGLLNSLLNLGPSLSQGLNGLGNRFPTVSPLPISQSGGSSSLSNFGRCRCIPDDQCRLPSINRGPCSGGIMCCRSSGTRVLGSDENIRKTPSVRFQPADLRASLFGEIVRGTSNVIDDALDLILAPFLTQEDQQKLATRLATSSTTRRS